MYTYVNVYYVYYRYGLGLLERLHTVYCTNFIVLNIIRTNIDSPRDLGGNGAMVPFVPWSP